MDTGIGNVRDLAEGGDHRLLLVIHRVEAGGASCHQNDHQQHQQNRGAQLLQRGHFFVFSRVIGGPAIGSVVFHGWFSFTL